MRRAVAAALVAAALLAGCGGASGGEPAIATKDDYIAAGDEVCAGLITRFNDAGATDPKTAKDIVESADVLSDLYGDLLDGLGGLKLPQGAAARKGATDYVTAIKRTSALLGPLRTSAKAFEQATDARKKDPAAIAQSGNDVRKALDAFRASQAQANQRALEYGFNLCGNLD